MTRAKNDQVEPNILERMVNQTATTLWCDSCDPDEVKKALSWGAIGATSNPPIVLKNIRVHPAKWNDRAEQVAAEGRNLTEEAIAWRLVIEASVEVADLLLPEFEATRGRDGRMAIQVDPKLWRNSEAMVEQAVILAGIAKNIIVKIPATAAGILAIEEATYRGVTTLATVLFTVSQAVAVAEAVERGLLRREQEGLSISDIHPKCAIMVGRLDDWLKSIAARDGIIVEPGCLDWAGVAVFKRAYALFVERGYRVRLLSAAFRNHLHWSEFVGGAVTVSPPLEWQLKYIKSDVILENKIDDPVPESLLQSLSSLFEDFRRAYDPCGLKPEEFEDFGATQRTLRQFLGAMDNLQSFVRDSILPDPINHH